MTSSLSLFKIFYSDNVQAEVADRSPRDLTLLNVVNMQFAQNYWAYFGLYPSSGM
jgi:hypothetical protein